MKRKTHKVKYMTEEQLKRIIANNYMGDPSKGYGFDYGADLKDEIDQRLWELQQKKWDKEMQEQMKEPSEENPTHFSCYYCFPFEGLKPIEEIKKGTYSKGTKRGKCKKCHNAYVRQFHIRKAAENRPANYKMCNACDLLFCKSRNGVVLKLCPYCSSTDIESY